MEALLLSAEAHRAALLPASALPHALAALHHARRLSLDLLSARAVIALADIWLALGEHYVATTTMFSEAQYSSSGWWSRFGAIWDCHWPLAGSRYACQHIDISAAVRSLVFGVNVAAIPRFWQVMSAASAAVCCPACVLALTV